MCAIWRTEVASKFQKADIIHHKRSLIRIVSQENLEAYACERYWLIFKEFSRLLNSFSNG